MTVLIDRARGPNSIHVLIIGVGEHEHDRLDALEGLGDAVTRLYDWWRLEGEDRCLEGWCIGTVAVLASDQDEITLLDDAEAPIVPHRPEYLRVRQAIRDWLERVQAGGRGFVHWCGHGAMRGLDSLSPLQCLYCWDAGGGDLPKGIDWSDTLMAIRSMCGDSRISCFVDACRSPSLERRSLLTVFEDYEELPGDNVAVHYSARPGRKAQSWRKAIEAADFLGGPIGTEALLSALTLYGAYALADGEGYGISTVSLATAIQYRMRRIGGHIWPQDPDWKPAMLDLVPPWADEPDMLMPAPHAMMDVEPPPGDAVERLECSITRQQGTGKERIGSSRLRFETSVGYGDYDIVLVDKPERRETKPEARPFSAKLPYHVVKMRRVPRDR